MQNLDHALDFFAKIVAAVAAALVTRWLAKPAPPALPPGKLRKKRRRPALPGAQPR